MLARALALPSNLIVLDEPTNDLDMETLDLLQELLGEYKGTILIVSHDRDFLDRVASSVIVGGGGRSLEYAGGYSDMVAQRGFGLSGAPAAAQAATAEKTWQNDRLSGLAAKRKLGFNERRALETLPGRDREASRGPWGAGRQARRRRLPGPRTGCVRGRDQDLCGRLRDALAVGRGRVARTGDPPRGARAAVEGLNLRTAALPTALERDLVSLYRGISKGVRI